MAMHSPRVEREEPALAEVIPLFPHQLDGDEDDFFDDDQGLILRFVDDYAEGPGAS